MRGLAGELRTHEGFYNANRIERQSARAWVNISLDSISAITNKGDSKSEEAPSLGRWFLAAVVEMSDRGPNGYSRPDGELSHLNYRESARAARL